MDRIRTKIVTQALQLFENNQSVEKIKETLPILFPAQNKINIETLIEKSIEMYCSLGRSVDEAGGTGYHVDALCEMKVIDLIQVLSVNHIRFIYTKKDEYENYINPNQKLIKIKNFANEMLNEFEEQLEENPDNFVAAMAIDIYEEILEKIENGK